MIEPSSTLRIRLTAVFGGLLTVASLVGILWLLDVFSSDQYPVPYLLTVKEVECPIVLSFNFGFTVEYGEPNPSGPQRTGNGTLVTVSMTSRDTQMSSRAFGALNCRFEIDSSAPIRSALVTMADGDDRNPNIQGPTDGALGKWSVEIPSESFGGYVWLYVDDISLARSFENRMARMSVTFESKTKGVLFQSDEDPEPHRMLASVTLPAEHEVRSFAPYDMRIRGVGIYESDPVVLSDHEWRYGIDVTYASPGRSQWYQILLIGLSTLFGVGVSAVIESFLASGVITLHRRVLADVVESAELDSSPAAVESDEVPSEPEEAIAQQTEQRAILEVHENEDEKPV